jgi:hypothetical protein
VTLGKEEEDVAEAEAGLEAPEELDGIVVVPDGGPLVTFVNCSNSVMLEPLPLQTLYASSRTRVAFACEHAVERHWKKLAFLLSKARGRLMFPAQNQSRLTLVVVVIKPVFSQAQVGEDDVAHGELRKFETRQFWPQVGYCAKSPLENCDRTVVTKLQKARMTNTFEEGFRCIVSWNIKTIS